ncbi:HNH endonuclease signature motif containing protein [Mycobacterium sp. 050272]|uniref:HNH endonuclease signature motif containing protein n=1 Tax=Mycobacterium sp. 050272 TaxID=3142488 RepID=UPI0031916DAE
MPHRVRVCSVPGCPGLQPESRCEDHRRESDRFQRATTPTKVARDADRARRKAAVDAHRAQHGDWCPGFNRPPHHSTDLTADHIDEISRGGAPDGELQVLCRSCNSRKAGTRKNRTLRGRYRAGPTSLRPTP